MKKDLGQACEVLQKSTEGMNEDQMKEAMKEMTKEELEGLHHLGNACEELEAEQKKMKKVQK